MALKSSEIKSVAFISLGCPKNLVDSEVMMGKLKASGYEITSNASEADTVVVNTCGFIESAKQESIEAILDAGIPYRVPAAEEPSNYRWTPGVWQRLKARVDIAPDGSGVVRAKAWKRDEAEPEKWTIEVPHKTAHHNGSPGLYGFAPQEMRVYIDNIRVTSN